MAQSDKVRQFQQIILALEQFEARKNSLFSLEKLAKYLYLSEQELKEMLELVFRFQNLFSSVFTNHVLVKKWKNDKSYLILKDKSDIRNNGEEEPKEIDIDKEQAKLLNDIVYYFQHVKIGKGFNVKRNGTELSKKVKQFNRSHPFFFERRGNGLIYPSKLAVKAGKFIQSYKKSKKTISKIEIEEYLINII